MGILSKAWKGIRSIGSSIVKRVKKTIKSIGKFVNKIGIAGQFALSLMLPGAGELFGALTKTMMNSTMKGILGSAVRGAGKFLNVGVKLGNRVGSVFKSISKGVTDLVGNTVQSTINALPEPLANGIRQATEKISFGKLKADELAKASFKDTFNLAGKIFTDTGTSLKTLFSKSTFDSTYNKFSQAIADKQAAAVKLTSDDIVKNVNDQVDGNIQTRPQSSKTLFDTSSATQPATKQTSSMFDFDPNIETGSSIGVDSNVGGNFGLDGQSFPTNNINQTAISKPELVTTTPKPEILKEVEVTAKRVGDLPLASAASTPRKGLLDRKIWGTDVTPKEAVGQAVVSTGENIIKGLGMQAAGLGPKPAQYTSSSFVFNPDFSGATGVGLSQQSETEQGFANYVADYNQNNFNFMNEFPYGYNAYMHFANRENERRRTA